MRLSELSNDELLSTLTTLIGNERRVVTETVACLAAVEERRIHLELAYSSMWDFCVRRLRLSDGEAHRRLTAARLIRRFPKLLDPMMSEQLLLSSVVLLRDLLTADNIDELIATASAMTKREVERLVAKLAPKSDVESSIRRLPEQASLVASGTGALPGALGLSLSPTPPPTSTPIGRQVSPLSESRYKVELTASESLREKLETARALMSHRNPSGDLAIVVEQALVLLIAKLEKDKLGKTERPRTARPSSDPAHISNEVRRKVAERDEASGGAHKGAQCAYVSPDGKRCVARSFLELDHKHPKALGGTGDVSNVRMLCRPHNRYQAEQVFGRAYVEERIHLRRKKSRKAIDRGTERKRMCRVMSMTASSGPRLSERRAKSWRRRCSRWAFGALRRSVPSARSITRRRTATHGAGHSTCLSATRSPR